MKPYAVEHPILEIGFLAKIELLELEHTEVVVLLFKVCTSELRRNNDIPNMLSHYFSRT